MAKCNAGQTLLALVHVLTERALFSQVANELSANRDGKSFPNYLCYFMFPMAEKKIERDWIIYSDSKKALFCLPPLLKL